VNPWNLDALHEIEQETERRVFTIHQLRLHPVIVALRERVRGRDDIVHDVNLTYITSRGHWYQSSWKGDETKSGGVAANIGVHFFDMLTWIFGARERSVVHIKGRDAASGVLYLRRARVRWFLSIDAAHLPEAQRAAGQRTLRSIVVDGEEVEFSEGFTDLHSASYRQILDGGGVGLDAAREAVETVHEIRQARIAPLTGDYHPYCAAVR
jgi:UDP-N-acetyl-2-amino-2-deoxyglucuronate dehydrogenase